ncbi:MAG: c-type cytochrome [Proteobacteria bacterium]|nr:c-type cytochrome [Pseudomonadota bacterium]
MRVAMTALLGLALIGCSDSKFDNPMHASGSKTLVASADGSSVHVVNVEEGTVSTVHVGSEAVITTAVGGEPTRIARHGDRVFVTLRTEGSLAVLQETADGLSVEQTLELGSEPFGVVVSEQGQVYVALSREDKVVALDAETLELTGEWAVPNEPRWLAVSAANTLFVGSQKQGGIYQVDLDNDEVTELTPQPTTLQNAVREVTLTTRVTGDPAVTPDGRFLLVPVLDVDNQTTADEAASAGNNTYYAEVTAGPGRFNPGAAVFGLDTSGRVARTLPTLHAVAAVETTSALPRVVRSFPSSITISPDGKDFWLPMEGSRTVVALTEGDADRANIFDVRTFLDHAQFVSGGFAASPRAAKWTGNGPRSVVYLDRDTAVVHNWLDRSVVPFDAKPFYSGTGEEADPIGLGIRVAESTFDPELERGRLSFHTAVDDMMQANGAGVSCATCHFDGREDGLSWPLEGGPRQTPTLVGVVSETTPITWQSNVESVAEEVQLTSQGRMGGTGATGLVALEVEAYIDFTRQPMPSMSLDAQAVNRGEAIFNRPEVGCADCHPAPTYTDGESHAVRGDTSVNTPTLRGLAASAPYFHDGSSQTLEDVLSTAVIGTMGDASTLSDDEIADLGAFLKSL